MLESKVETSQSELSSGTTVLQWIWDFATGKNITVHKITKLHDEHQQLSDIVPQSKYEEYLSEY